MLMIPITALTVHNRQMAEASGGHQLHRLAVGRPHRGGLYMLGHDLAGDHIQRRGAVLGEALDDIAFADDAGEMVAVHHKHGPDAPVGKHGGDVRDGRVGVHGGDVMGFCALGSRLRS